MNAVARIIKDAERLYTKLEVEQLRRAIAQSEITEAEVKALFLSMADDVVVFENGVHQSDSGNS